MNKLSTNKRVQVVKALVEGNSIRSIVRMTGVAKNTIVKLLAELGSACAAYHNEFVCGLKPISVQCDEIWCFCYSKQKNVPEDKKGFLGYGDVWTWTALDPDSKLMIGYHVGLRSPDDAREFMLDLSNRIANITQLATDGYQAYPEAVRRAFGDMVDYAQIHKVYRAERPDHARYSPALCVGTQKRWVQGFPNSELTSTSHVERSNLTMRMGMRRFTRLTNAFSKKIDNLKHAVALHFLHYNFCRVHQSIRVTPAMQAGLSDHVWEIEEIIGLLDGVRSN